MIKNKNKFSLRETDLNSFADYIYNKKHYNNTGNLEYHLISNCIRNFQKKNSIEYGWKEKYNLYKNKQKQQISTKHLINKNNFKIAYISDIHINQKINQIKSIVENISKELKKII